MSTLYPDTHASYVLSPDRIESLPGFAEVRQRFVAGFDPAVNRWKHKAVKAVLAEEFGCPDCPGGLIQPRFIAEIMRRIDEAAIREKRYVFISLDEKRMARMLEEQIRRVKEEDEENPPENTPPEPNPRFLL